MGREHWLESKLLDKRLHPMGFQRFLRGYFGAYAFATDLANLTHGVSHPHKRELAAPHVVDRVQVRRRSEYEVNRTIFSVQLSRIAPFDNGGRANYPRSILKGSLVDPRLRASNYINAPSKLARYLSGMGAD